MPVVQAETPPTLRAAAALAFACLIATAAVLAGGPARSVAALTTKLRQQPCPELAIPKVREFNKREVALARRGRFIIAGDRVKLKPKANWRKNLHEREFQEQLHSFRWAGVLFQAYLEGDRNAIGRARRLAVDWVRQNPLDPPKPGKGKGKGKGKKPPPLPPLAWQNLVAGDRASHLGFITRASACEGMLPRRPAKTMLRALETHGRFLASDRGYFESNHGLFTDLGLFLLADRYVPFFPQAQGWANLARDRFPRTLAGRTSGSGVWLEHSTDYQFLAMRKAKDFLRFAGADERISPVLARLEDTAPWFIEPDGKLPLIGDTSADRAAIEYRKAARKLDGYRAFLDAGFFVVNRAKRYFAAMAGFHNGSHKHADELSFELFDRDTRVITGPGKYGFDRDKRRDYVLSSPAHSVLTVDGKSFTRDPKAAYGSGLIASGEGDHGWFAALARNPLVERQGVTHTRLYVYHPLVGLFILDNLDSRTGRHQYRRYLQFGQEVGVDRHRKRGLELTSKGDFDGCVRDEVEPAVGSKLRIDRGDKDPYRGYTFPKGEKAVPRWTATYRSKAEDVSHLFGIGLQRGCPFSVQRVEGPGLLDFVLTREGQRTVRVSVSQSAETLNVTETRLDADPPPPTPLPPLPPVTAPYGENP